MNSRSLPPWRLRWIQEQVRQQPSSLFLAVPGFSPDDSESWDSHFMPIWYEIRDQMLESTPKSIDSMVQHLMDRGLLVVAKDYYGLQSAQDLVFACIGWHTMLYQPLFETPSHHPSHEFSIVDEMDEHIGEAHVRHTQTRPSSKRNLPDFLLGFGVMLPPKNFCAFDDQDDRNAFAQIKRACPEDLDAYLLSKMCGIRFEWIDSLSCHLELDKNTNTLFLYRYPSFCVENLQQHMQGKADMENSQSSILCSCASDSAPRSWAQEEDVVELLQEILLSYRLIFGQSRRSRKLFRKLRPFPPSVPRTSQDRLLLEICTQKDSECDDVPADQLEYDLIQDFPHLRGRLSRLRNHVSLKKPRSLKELWLDNRDSATWLTFWAVLIFGSMGVLLSLLQLIFQVLQWAQGLHSGGD